MSNIDFDVVFDEVCSEILENDEWSLDKKLTAFSALTYLKMKLLKYKKRT